MLLKEISEADVVALLVCIYDFCSFCCCLIIFSQLSVVTTFYDPCQKLCLKVTTFCALGFIHIYSHASILHIILSFIKPFNLIVFSFTYHK